MDEFPKRPSFISAVVYDDPMAALDWLERAFGFERAMLITDNDGKLAHSEMNFGSGTIMVSGPWRADMVSPRSNGGRMTQLLHVQLTEGLDAHCTRARAAGAVITREPEDQFYGDRVYAATDPEGHNWSFGQTVRVVTREQAAADSGLTIEGWN